MGSYTVIRWELQVEVEPLAQRQQGTRNLGHLLTQLPHALSSYSSSIPDIPFHFRWTVTRSINYMTAIWLHISDGAQPITGSSAYVVTWCPVLKHSVSTRAQSHAENCAQMGFKFLLQAAQPAPGAQRPALWFSHWGSPRSLPWRIFPQHQHEQHHRVCRPYGLSVGALSAMAWTSYYRDLSCSGSLSRLAASHVTQYKERTIFLGVECVASRTQNLAGTVLPSLW